MQNFTIDVQREVLRPRAQIAEFFFQDDFKASDRLTLNLGVRYTLNFPSTVVDDQGAVFNLQTQKLDFLGQERNSRAARNLEKLNFAPRVGLAFRLSDSFIVRSGYGMTWIEQAGITTPFTTPLFPFIQTAGQRSLDNINPAFVLSARSLGAGDASRIRTAVWARVCLRSRGSRRADTRSNGIFPSRRPSADTGAWRWAIWVRS